MNLRDVASERVPKTNDVTNGLVPGTLDIIHSVAVAALRYYRGCLQKQIEKNSYKTVVFLVIFIISRQSTSRNTDIRKL